MGIFKLYSSHIIIRVVTMGWACGMISLNVTETGCDNSIILSCLHSVCFVSFYLANARCELGIPRYV
jgi:hypothetical protein